MPTDLINDIHTKTTKLNVHELVRQLNEHLGATLVAVIAGVRDRKLPYKWAKEDGPVPGVEAEGRLRAAHRVWTYVSTTENDHVARAWFIGANPLLDEQPPVVALNQGHTREVLAAAHAFTEDSYAL